MVILIHEWWDLNDNIKAMAEDIRDKGFHALAIDCLTARSPRIPRRPAQTKAVQAAEANTTITSWVNWAKANGNGKVATLGWCFGGGWSLSAALANPLDAAVIYYGQVTASAKSLATLSVPLLGHFGTMDKSINPEMVGASQKRLSEAGKANMLTTHWYTAGHAFANPTGSRKTKTIRPWHGRAPIHFWRPICARPGPPLLIWHSP